MLLNIFIFNSKCLKFILNYLCSKYNRKMKKLLLSVILISAFFSHYGQTVSLNAAELSQGKILIKYSIDNPSNLKLDAKLYTSLDNYVTPLKKTTGNIGENIQNGNNELIWDYKAEGMQLSEEIEFEIKLTKIKPKYSSVFAHNNNFFWVPNEFSNKSPNTFYFRLNDPDAEMIIELHQNGEKLMMIDFITKKEEYTWQPKNIDGKYYQIKMVNKNNVNDFVVSNLFIITNSKVNSVDFDWKHAFYVDLAQYSKSPNVINWTNALLAENYKISLYLNNKFDRVIDVTSNQSYLWDIPESLERSFNAQLKIEDASNPANYIISNTFTILNGKYKVKSEIREELIRKETGVSSTLKMSEAYKRGSSVPVIFENMIKASYLIVELYKDEKLVKTLDIIENKGFYNWKINESEEKGDDYQLKFTDKENNANFIYTSKFKIEK